MKGVPCTRLFLKRYISCSYCKQRNNKRYAIHKELVMEKYVIVRTLQGLLRGKKVHTKTGTVFYSFQGIPYAKPPVGNLRFKAPQPTEAWKGVRDALEEGHVAPHIDDFLTTNFLGQEDCLFLNVYTPQLTEMNQCKAVPVMFWIHGGGFYVGSGNSDFYGPDYLVNQNVLLVTINYRLGALGFLSTGDAVIPGNNGLKDQVMALRWVQQNISKFGGDPNNVTIFGESAGGACAHMHMFSPMSQVCNPWAFEEPSAARERAIRFGKVLGCKDDLLQDLSRLSAKDLVEGMHKALTYDEKHPLPLYFRPTIDAGSQDGVFLQENPIKLLKQGKFQGVPFLTGVTSHEGMFVLKDAVLCPEWFKMFEKDFKIPIPHGIKPGKEQDIFSKVRKLYFGSKKLSKETWREFVDMYTDVWFSSPAWRTVKEQIKHSASSVYMYRFSFDGALGFADQWVGEARFPVAPHIGLYAQKELKNSALLPHHRDPSLEGGACWEPATTTQIKYLNIDKVLSLSSNMEDERMAFWENVYDEIGSSN
ncbi:hypothetical protein C0J52_24363 [Blattella germanica]|nr:hypothetical protein C0J52_24363 [Blattella germanica]